MAQGGQNWGLKVSEALLLAMQNIQKPTNFLIWIQRGHFISVSTTEKNSQDSASQNEEDKPRPLKLGLYEQKGLHYQIEPYY